MVWLHNTGLGLLVSELQNTGAATTSVYRLKAQTSSGTVLVAGDKANKLISLCTAPGALEKKSRKVFCSPGSWLWMEQHLWREAGGHPISKTGHSLSTNTHLLTIFTLARLDMRKKNTLMEIRELKKKNKPKCL